MPFSPAGRGRPAYGIPPLRGGIPKASSGSVLGPEVEDRDVVEDGTKHSAEGLVVGMRQVGGTIGLGFEDQHEVFC